MKRFLFPFLLLTISLFVCSLLTNQTQIVSSSNLYLSLPKTSEKLAYLTFDDGPSPNVTPKILDILDEENVKATFFVIGKKVEEHPEIVKDAYYRGHYIANHTYSHDNHLLYQSEDSFLKELQKTEEAIRKAIGQEDYTSHLFRFPNGFMSPCYKNQKQKMLPVLEEHGYTYLDWNALNSDSIKKYTPYELFQNLKKTIQNKATLVILIHDTKDVSDSSTILKESIEYLKKQGYIFRSLEDYLEE